MLQFRIHVGRYPGSSCRRRHGICTNQCIVAVTIRHKVSRILILQVFICHTCQKSGKIGVPLGGNTHTVCHLMTHGEGNGHSRNLGIYRCFAGNTHGNTGDAHGGIHIRPAQFLYRQFGTGKYRIGEFIDQRMEAASGFLRQCFKIIKCHVALCVTLHLGCKKVCLIPVVNSCTFQLFHSILAHIQTNIFRQGTCIIVQTEHQCVQKINGCGAGQHPAKPPDRIPSHHDHQHNADDQSDSQQQRTHLPQTEADAGRPLRQHIQHRAGDIGIDHVHQLLKFLCQPHQSPGNGTNDSGCQKTSPIFQRKSSSLNAYTL